MHRPSAVALRQGVHHSFLPASARNDAPYLPTTHAPGQRITYATLNKHSSRYSRKCRKTQHNNRNIHINLSTFHNKNNAQGRALVEAYATLGRHAAMRQHEEPERIIIITTRDAQKLANQCL